MMASWSKKLWAMMPLWTQELFGPRSRPPHAPALPPACALHVAPAVIEVQTFAGWTGLRVGPSAPEGQIAIGASAHLLPHEARDLAFRLWQSARESEGCSSAELGARNAE